MVLGQGNCGVFTGHGVRAGGLIHDGIPALAVAPIVVFALSTRAFGGFARRGPGLHCIEAFVELLRKIDDRNLKCRADGPDLDNIEGALPVLAANNSRPMGAQATR